MARTPLRLRDFLVPLLARVMWYLLAALLAGYTLFVLNVYLAIKVLQEFGLL